MSEEKFIVRITFEEYEKIAIDWARDYANDVEGIEKLAFNSAPYRFCIVDMYKTFVRKDKIKYIYKLPVEQKQSIYEEFKRIFGEADELKTRQLCIFLYFMNYIFETYFT